MKSEIKTLIAVLTTPLLFASCSDEVAPKPAGDTSVVTITAQLPDGLSTRAFGNGTTATHLQYAVYESGQRTPLKVYGNDTQTVGTATMSDLKATVQLQLVAGKTYDVVFFADAASGSPYTFNASDRNVTVDYVNAVANDENRDAFFAIQSVSVDGNKTMQAELHRPFAQLNVGSNDVAAAKAAGQDVSKSELTVSVANTLDLTTGEASGFATQTFKLADVPGAAETFPVAGYDYLSMNYLLVNVDKTLVDVDFKVGDGTSNVERTFTAVPVQRNYRTNIYGSLLTNTVDVNVEIKPEFEGVSEISTDAELKAAALCPGRHIQLADNASLTLPDQIAENVVITGGENSMLKGGTFYNTITSSDVTFNNVTFDKMVYITGDNVTLDNVKIGTGVTSSWSLVQIGQPNVTFTLKNITTDKTADSGILTYAPGVKVVLENCDFGKNFKNVINLHEGQGNVVEAKNCKFYGRMNGMDDSSFTDCTFANGNVSYPYMRIWGNGTFKNCTFGKLGKQMATTPTGGYDQDFAVVCSVAAGTYDFTGCKYSDGSALDANLMRNYKTIGSISKIIIDGVAYLTGFKDFTV